MSHDMVLRIYGKAGEGIDLAGLILAEACVSAGYRVFTNAEHCNSIKGGNNDFQINVSTEQADSHGSAPHVILALDQAGLREAQDSAGDAVMLYDEIHSPAQVRENWISLPLRASALAHGGEIMKNMVGVGAVAAAIGLPIEKVTSRITARLAAKGAELAEQNAFAALAGYGLMDKGVPSCPRLPAAAAAGKQVFANGNMLAAMGALRAGCTFMSAYPMTPSSTILHFMAKHAKEYGVSVLHVEDEIAAANMAIGAGYAGSRSMTATSGGGYALMSEAVSFAGMIEAPVVFFEVQRPGPSTGLPTRTGQGDLRQVLHAGQGSFPHIVISPTNHEECFACGYEAFDLAERYQCPVTVLMEKYLAENYASLPYPDLKNAALNRGKRYVGKTNSEPFLRYLVTEDGISPRSVPGEAGGEHTASSYEHREDGSGTEDPAEVRLQNGKRLQKTTSAAAQVPEATILGPVDADLTLVCWGGTRGPACDAAKLLTAQGTPTNVIAIRYIRPLPNNIGALLSAARRLVLVEGNAIGQLGGWLREQTGIDIKENILDASGRPFTPQMILVSLNSLLAGHI